ncbi:MAG TPA: GDCCVxC domain-containing (seleno)protein [Vicinamibacterales bacterium]|nr:GDCCVxC domain-containing (seleno)protein [Vicinamibacterales bacterium]
MPPKCVSVNQREAAGQTPWAPPNRVCSWRRSCGTRGGARSARVHRAALFGPPQLKPIRSAGVPERLRTMSLVGTITCPACRAQTPAPIPLNACLFFFDCPACGAHLRSRPGDCCVFAPTGISHVRAERFRRTSRR